MKVLVVFGTRPEAVKLAPVILELQKHPQFETTVCVTAQHREMLDKVGQVEAGLRTGDKFNPFPEEIHRRLTDALADWCFAPTERAHQNLLSEGIPVKKIFITGNTAVDALQHTVSKLTRKLKRVTWPRENVSTCKLILVTAHRRESFGPGLESICLGLKKIAEHC